MVTSRAAERTKCTGCSAWVRQLVFPLFQIRECPQCGKVQSTALYFACDSLTEAFRQLNVDYVGDWITREPTSLDDLTALIGREVRVQARPVDERYREQAQAYQQLLDLQADTIRYSLMPMRVTAPASCARITNIPTREMVARVRLTEEAIRLSVEDEARQDMFAQSEDEAARAAYYTSALEEPTP